MTYLATAGSDKRLRKTCETRDWDLLKHGENPIHLSLDFASSSYRRASELFIEEGLSSLILMWNPTVTLIRQLCTSPAALAMAVFV